MTTGSATINISDPPVCRAMFDHVYVTITRVRAHISSSAGVNDAGWVDLVDLQSNPRQVDLFSLASTTCMLTQLGSASGLPPGKYQQIRLYLLDNSAASGPSPNACGNGNGFNCAVPVGGSPRLLKLSSEAQTGIKIPPGQIAGGGITIQAGQSADFNIDFDSCASIVHQGNGEFRLKPTLRASEVALNNNSLSGKVVDSTSNNPVEGAIILLEQPDSGGIDRVVNGGMTGPDGTFIFCPLPNPDGNATYDVVIAAQTISSQLVTTTYNATIAFKVPLGTALNSPPLTLVPESTSPAGSPGATITGQVTSAGAGAVAVDVTLSALQQATPTSGSPLLVTIPVFGALAQPPTVMTTDVPASGPACPASTDCFNYSLVVPGSNPQVGTFSGGSIAFSAPMAGTVAYSLNGIAPMCTGATPTSGTIDAIAVTPGGTAAVSTPLAFTGCTAP
jgi:hypothetical protein